MAVVAVVVWGEGRGGGLRCGPRADGEPLISFLKCALCFGSCAAAVREHERSVQYRKQLEGGEAIPQPHQAPLGLRYAAPVSLADWRPCLRRFRLLAGGH